MQHGLPPIDMASPAFWADPYGQLAAARSQAPFASIGPATLMAISYDAVDTVLRDPRFGTMDLLARTGIDDGPLHDWWGQVMFSQDPPEHTRLRSLVGRAFTPRRAEAHRHSVERICHELVDGFPGGELDIVTAYAHEVPIRVMAELLGIPATDLPTFARWTSDLGDVFATVMTPALRAHLEETVLALGAYVEDLLGRRRRTPGDDLLTALIEAEEAGDRLSTSELVAMVQNLLFAGHDTTRSLIMIGTALLCQHPDQRATLAAAPELMAGAVDEILRYEAPTLGGGRTALVGAEVCGVAIAAGTPVATSSLGANRDPEAYPDPDRFDVRRAGPRHMAFGSGIHHCLGAALARVEGQVALGVLLARCPALQLTASPQWVPYASVRRFDALTVRR